MDKTPEQIAGRLNSAQRAFILNASKAPKKWMTIRRHAKLVGPVRVHGLHTPYKLLFWTKEQPDRYALTPLGQQVKAILQQENTNADQ